MKVHVRKAVFIQAVSLVGRGGHARLATLAAAPETDGPGRLTEGPRELARLRIVVGNLERVREEKVRALAALVASGRYRVDAHEVARAMLRDLLGPLLA